MRMRLKEALTEGRQVLALAGVPQSRREAADLLSFVIKSPSNGFFFNEDKVLSPQEIGHWRSLISRRAQREPFAYLTERIDFLGCQLAVTADVLVPRQETEILAEKIIQTLPPDEEKVAWDLCCGSGCLGIAIQQARPRLEMTLSDVSEKALDLARLNGERNGVQARYLLGDLLAPFKGEKADYLFCNPPYLAEKEYALVEPEVRCFEPRSALVAGVSGVEFFIRLARELPSLLAPSARVFFEIGASQGRALEKIFSGKEWKNSFCVPDWAGKERFFFLEFCP